MNILRPKILIADDEPSIRDAIKAVLLSEHYEIVIAKNGREAVEMFKKESPDLVILDVVMPYLNGFQVLKEIKKFFVERYIPVIFLTASVTIDHKLEALGGGAVDYLTKPVAPQEILARIRNFLDIKAQHDKFKEAAVYDWMTGAMNKGHFIERAREELEKAIRNKIPISFIFMDIDAFKKINDAVGHMGGDAVIAEFGRRLKKAVRKIDLLGRFGGDEFMIMLPHKGKKESGIVADRISKIISSRPMVFEKTKVKVTTSQGIVAVDSDKNLTIDQLMRTADEALYEAKAKGGNCFVLKTVD